MVEKYLAWEQAGWLESAQTWIRTELERNELEMSGEIEQPHIRPWSTVLRVTTSEGTCFFKATAPYFAHETALTGYLARVFPQLSREIIAMDVDQHWLLMRDAGKPLRSFIKDESSIEPWRLVLPLYVDLQKSLAAHQSELLNMGVMDRRLIRLPEMFQVLLANETCMLIDQPEGLTAEEYQCLKASGHRFGQMCARLANYGIPESLHHDDFHDGNVFVNDGRIIFTDWGESAVTHPFFSLVVMLRSVENSLDLPPNAPEMQNLRDWYLELWSDYGPLEKLSPVVGLAERLGYVNRALTWNLVISQLPEPLKPEYASAVPAYLKEFINSIGDA